MIDSLCTIENENSAWALAVYFLTPSTTHDLRHSHGKGSPLLLAVQLPKKITVVVVR
jgi:hypothetical protein